MANSWESEYRYSVDAADTIIAVDDAWLAFARDNDAPHLGEEAVIGAPLFGFLYGDETKRLYRLLLDRVRSTRRTLTVPFRCDGPKVRRFMELRIELRDADQVEFAGRMIHEERRPAVRLLDPSVARSGETLVICAWCKKVRIENGNWGEVEEAVSRLGLFESMALPDLIHGVCDACLEQVEDSR